MENKSIKAKIPTLSITDDPQYLYQISCGEYTAKHTHEDIIEMQEVLNQMDLDETSDSVPYGIAYRMLPLVWSNPEGVITDPVDYLMNNREEVIDYFGFDVSLGKSNDVTLDGKYNVGMCGTTSDEIVRKVLKREVFDKLDEKIVRIMTELFEQR